MRPFFIILKQSVFVRIVEEGKSHMSTDGEVGKSTTERTDPSQLRAPPNNRSLAPKAAFGIPLRNMGYSDRKALLSLKVVSIFFL